MALSMARAKEEGMRYSEKEHTEAQSKDTNPGVVPLYIPLMAGPAAMSVAIIDAGISTTFFFKIGPRSHYPLFIGVSLDGHVSGRADCKDIRPCAGPTSPHSFVGLVLLALAIEFIVVGITQAFHLTR